MCYISKNDLLKDQKGEVRNKKNLKISFFVFDLEILYMAIIYKPGIIFNVKAAIYQNSILTFSVWHNPIQIATQSDTF